MKRRAATVAAATLGLGAVSAAPTLAHGTGQGAPPTDLPGILLAWHIDIPMILALGVAGAAYLSAAGLVNEAHPSNRWPRRRTVAFLLALVAIGSALLSPIDSLSDDLLTVHMAQHLLLVAVAAPLIAASGIGTLALRFATPSTRNRVLLPILHSRIVTVLTFPVVGWIAFAGVMWGSHFSGLYDAALLDDGVHALEHLLYVAAALLFWWPLLSPDPLRHRLHPGAKLIALLAQMAPMSLLAVTIVMARQVLYPAYLGRSDPFGISPILDQQIAGSFMWIAGDLALLIPGAFLFYKLMRHEELEEKRVDARLDRARAQAQKVSR